MALNEFIGKDSSGTFLHEYIHFLQDLYTAYGVVNFSKILEEIKAFYCLYKQRQEIEIPIPFNQLSNSQKKNQSLFSLYFQKNKYGEQDCTIIKISEKQNNCVPGFPVNTYYANLKNGDIVPLGSCCIIEGMAQLIQELQFPSSRKNQVSPYDLVPGIASYYLGDALSKNQLAILCDISLFYLNSIECLIKSINTIKQNPNLLKLPLKDFYSYFLSHLFVHDSDQVLSLIDYYCKCVDTAIDEVNGVFTSNLYFDLRDWIVNKLQAAKVVKQQCDPFLLLSSPNTSIGRDEYYNLLCNYGIPPVQNEDGALFIPNFDLNGISSHLLMAVQSVFYTIYHGSRKCLLIECCREYGKWSVSEECDDHPWNKTLENGELCPFCAVWKAFGLKGKLVVEIQ